MKLLQKVRRLGLASLEIETAIEFDDGTRHHRTGMLTIIHDGLIGVSCSEWQTVCEWFGEEAHHKHLVIDLEKQR